MNSRIKAVFWLLAVSSALLFVGVYSAVEVRRATAVRTPLFEVVPHLEQK